MQSTSTVPTKMTRRTQAERRDVTREKILNAAVALLLSRGYASFRVSDVADAAQVSRGAQTHHFPTKSSLLLAVLERVYADSIASSMSRIQMLRPGDDPLDLLFEEAKEFFMGPNFAIALDLLNMGDADPQLREAVQELSRIHRLPLEQHWIEALIKFGVDPERAKSIVWMSYALYRGLAMRATIQEDPEHNARVMSEWKIIAHQQIASAKK